MRRAAVGTRPRRRSRRAPRSGTRRRECPAHRRRSRSNGRGLVMRPPPCRGSRPPAPPGAPRNWNGGTSTALACSCPNCPTSPSSAAVDIDDDRHRCRRRQRSAAPRLEIGGEDPAVDERRAQAAALDSVDSASSARSVERDGVAPGRERRRDEVAIGLIDVRDEDAGVGFRRRVDPRRQQNRERRPHLHLARHRDLAAVVAHDAVADAQPESGALADFARREERVEDPARDSRDRCRGRCR